MKIITDEMWDAFWNAADPSNGKWPTNVEAGIAAVAPLLVAAEREACAVIADAISKDRDYELSRRSTAMAIAERIRARSS